MARMYESCPTTQLVSLLALAGTVFVSGPFESLAFNLPAILLHGEVYRIFTSSFVFKDMGQTFYGLILLYTCRNFERLLGLRKFGAFTALAYIFSIAANLIITSILNLSMGVEYIPASGPYFLIYSLLSLYYSRVPRIHASQYTLLGALVFSEKTWIYLLAAHLAFSMVSQSLAPALVGILFGFAYDRNLLGLQGWRLPQPIERVFAMVGGFAATLVPAGAAPTPINRRGGGGGFGGGGGGVAPSAPPLQPPPEESITLLCNSLGVDRAAAVEALQVTGNDVDAAANYLLR